MPAALVQAGNWIVFFQFQEVIVQKPGIAFLMSAAIIAAASFQSPAAAETVAHRSASTHVIVFRLPDGSLEHIRYAGNRPPQVRIDGQPDQTPGLFDPFWPPGPFADLDRISAAIDHEAAAMLQQADSMMQASPGGRATVGHNEFAAGVQGYSIVSTMAGNTVCTRSVHYSSTSDGKPHVQSSTSGNCTPRKAASTPIQAKPLRPAFKPKASGIIQVKATPPAAVGNAPPLRLASTVN